MTRRIHCKKKTLHSLAVTTLFAMACASCNKDKQDHTSMLNGNYNWHHRIHSIRAFMWDTVIHYPDETFEIVANNRTHIMIMGKELAYKSEDDAIITFVRGTYMQTIRTLNYNKVTGQISYYIAEHISAGGSSQEVYETY